MKKAKELLKEAGVENLTFDMYANLDADTTRVGEIIKQQMAEAGITVNLLNTTNIVQDFFTDQKAPSSLIPLRRAGLDKVTRNLTPGSIGNTCGYDDPKLNGTWPSCGRSTPARRSTRRPGRRWTSTSSTTRCTCS